MAMAIAAGVAGAMAWLGSAASPVAAADLRVVATIKPIHALVAGVMEGAGSPDLLVTGTASPHTFAMKPSGARALNAATVVFRVSPAVEPFTVKVAASLPATVRVVTLAEAPGVQLLPLRRGTTFDAHDHGDGAHDHDAAHDGHVWLDPDNAKAMVREIARVLTDVAPGEGARFAANAERVIGEIDAADREIKAELAPVAAQPYVVFHDAFQYFEHHYGLSPVAAMTIGPDVQPGAKRLSDIRARIRALKAVCVFAEPQFPARVMHAVSDGTAARFGTLDPEGALLEPGPGAYTALLRNMAASLKACLGSDGRAAVPAPR
jgi:zinc transport system substrate-binding protein